MTQRDDRARSATVAPEPPAGGPATADRSPADRSPDRGKARAQQPAAQPTGEQPARTATDQPARSEGTARPAHAARPPRVGAPTSTRSAPRRARLALKRVDPWSVLKLSLVLSLALFVVGIVAVAVLYGVLEGMGVPQAVNETVAEVTAGAGGESGLGNLLSLRRVLTVTAVVGLVNAVLLTALATLSAFLYNLCADVVGGIDVTLAERE